MLPSLIRDPSLESAQSQGRNTKYDGNDNSDERRHDHVPGPALALQPSPHAATRPRVLQLVVQL